MTYTAFDGTLARLMVASSLDLLHWTKHGPAFGQAYNGKYLNKWSKSGSIVSNYQRMVKSLPHVFTANTGCIGAM